LWRRSQTSGSEKIGTLILAFEPGLVIRRRAHDYNTDRNIGATLQALPGASFAVNGAAQAHDAALVTASAKKWLNGWSAAATFRGEFPTSNAGKGVVKYAW
jgi:hypothetical protein